MKRSSRIRKIAVTALLLGPLVAVSLVACGGSGSDSGNPTTPQGQNQGSKEVGRWVALCNQEDLSKGVDAWSEAYGGDQDANFSGKPGTFLCSQGWAVVFPEVGSGSEAVTVTVVLEAEGQFWIPRDRAKACGPTAAKSEVPKALFKDACQTN